MHIDNIKLSYYDGQDQDKLLKDLVMAHLPMPKYFQQVQVIHLLARNIKQHRLYSTRCNDYLVSTNIDRQSYNHTSKTTDASKTSTKKLC